MTQSFPNARIEEAHSGSDALMTLSKQPYDLYIVDLELPDMTGFELMERIRKESPRAKIIAHTMHDELWYYRKLEASGVDGIVYKSASSDQIVQATKIVMDGGRYLCDKAQEQRKNRHRTLRKDQELSERELHVLHCIAAGKNTSEIADELCISVNTVETHRRHLNEKLDATNVATLIMHAVAKGLLPIH